MPATPATAQPRYVENDDSIERFLKSVVTRGATGFCGFINTADGAKIFAFQGDCVDNPMQSLADIERLKELIVDYRGDSGGAANDDGEQS